MLKHNPRVSYMTQMVKYGFKKNFHFPLQLNFFYK